MKGKNFEGDLKYLVLGYRKHTGNTQSALAQKLGVPIEIETALEQGSYKYPTERLISKIGDLTSGFDSKELKQIGRGYWIEDRLGPDFKYFIRGLKSVRGIDSKELNSLSDDECYRIIGSVDMDEFEVVQAGRNI